jgi:NADH-quinone oxidoreductase subunit E
VLSEIEIREIEDQIRQAEQKQAACVEALKIVQRHQGWVSDESVRDLTHYLDMAAEEIDAIATFYNLILRRPVGRHVIFLCNSVSCWIMNFEDLRLHLTQTLGVDFGETTPDGRFTLLPIPCLGACDSAPAMMIDDELYVDLDRAKIDRILAGYE